MLIFLVLMLAIGFAERDVFIPLTLFVMAAFLPYGRRNK